jgi:hypothetical protein
METSSILYSLKVWLTSVLLAPVIYLVIQACLSKVYQLDFITMLNDQIAQYAVLVMFGGLFSLCTWLAFFLSVIGLILCFPSYSHLKYVIAVLGVLFTAGTFRFFLPESYGMQSEFFPLMLANCICIAAGSFFYKLEVTKQLSTT